MFVNDDTAIAHICIMLILLLFCYGSLW